MKISKERQNASAMTWEEIAERIEKARIAFLKFDIALLEVNANERSMTHKFAGYLQREFPGWNVDCEYNRKGGDPQDWIKTLNWKTWPVVAPDDENALTVFPDIIVHRRTQRNNLLVIEAKKSGNNNGDDRKKLDAFTETDDYRYIYGVLLTFVTTGNFDVRYERVGSSEPPKSNRTS